MEFIKRILAHSNQQPDSKALVWIDENGCEVDEMSYQNVVEDAQRISALLLGQDDLETGDRILLVFVPGLDFARAFLGCLFAGVVAVPVYPPDPRNPHPGMKKLLAAAELAQPKLILSHTEYFRMKRIQTLTRRGPPYPAHLRWVGIKEAAAIESSSMPMPKLDDRDALAFIQFTSGSTGDPKGVMISRGNLDANLNALQKTMCSTPKSTGVAWVPHYHDMGLVASLLHGLFAGSMCVYMSPLSFIANPFLWLQTVSKYNARITTAPNFAYDLCTRKVTSEQKAQLDLRSCTRWIIGAEPVQACTLRGFAEAFACCGFEMRHFAPTWGCAEIAVLASSRRAADNADDPTDTPVILKLDAKSLKEDGKIEILCDQDLETGNNTDQQDTSTVEVVSNGPSAVSVGVSVVAKGMLAADGVVGELWLHGTSKALGYYQRPEATKHAFCNHLPTAKDGSDTTLCYKTGDLGFVHNGDVFICGRLKDMMIVQGANVFPQDVESTVFETSATLLRPGCAAVFQLEESKDIIAVAELCHVPPSITSLCIQNLHSLSLQIRQRVRAFHGIQLHELCLLPPRNLPKTTSGKVQREACRKLYTADKLPVVYTLQSMERTQEYNTMRGTEGMEKLPDLSSPEAEIWLLDELKAILDLDETVLSSTSFDELGLMSISFVGLRTKLEKLAGCKIPHEIFASCENVAQLLASTRHYVSSKGGQHERLLPDVSLPPLPRHHSLKLSSLAFTAAQALAAVAIWAILLLCVIPSYHYYYWVKNQQPHYLVMELLLRPLVIPIWMTAFTLVLILLKWLVIGRYRSCSIPLQTLAFLRWWWIDRLFDYWEFLVGSLWSGTGLDRLTYMLLGARLAPDVTIPFIREFDLITVGSGSVVDGMLLARRFDASERTLCLRPVSLGSRCRVSTGAMVMPGCLVADDVKLEPTAVLYEGSQTVPAKVYSQKPACETGEDVSHTQVVGHGWAGVAAGRIISLLFTLYLFAGVMWPIHLLWKHRYIYLPASVITDVAAVIGLYIILGNGLLILLAVASKWVWIGRLQPSHVYNDSYGFQLARWTVDMHYRILYHSPLGLALDDGATLVTWWFNLYGANVHSTTITALCWGFTPSVADLFKSGPNSFVSNIQITPRLVKVGKELRAHAIEIKERASVGLLAVLEDSVPPGTVVPPFSHFEVSKKHSEPATEVGSPKQLPEAEVTIDVEHWLSYGVQRFKSRLTQPTKVKWILQEIHMEELALIVAGDRIQHLLQKPEPFEPFLEELKHGLLHQGGPLCECAAYLLKMLEQQTESDEAEAFFDEMVHWVVVMDSLTQALSKNIAFWWSEALPAIAAATEHNSRASDRPWFIRAKIECMAVTNYAGEPQEDPLKDILEGSILVKAFLRYNVLLAAAALDMDIQHGSLFADNTRIGNALADTAAHFEDWRQFRREDDGNWRYELDRDWYSVYQTWNACFVAGTTPKDKLARAIGILLMPNAQQLASPDDIPQYRIISLYLIVSSFSEATKEGPSLAGLKGEALQECGKINFRWAKKFGIFDRCAVDSPEGINKNTEFTLQEVVPSLNNMPWTPEGTRRALLGLTKIDDAFQSSAITNDISDSPPESDSLAIVNTSQLAEWKSSPIRMITALGYFVVRLVTLLSFGAALWPAIWLAALVFAHVKNMYGVEAAIMALTISFASAVPLATAWILVIYRAILGPRDRSIRKFKCAMPLYTLSQATWNIFMASPLTMALQGTAFTNIILRLMGARVGRGVFLNTTSLLEHWMLTIEDGAIVDRGYVVGHQFVHRSLMLGPVKIHKNTVIYPRSAALSGTEAKGDLFPNEFACFANSSDNVFQEQFGVPSYNNSIV